MGTIQRISATLLVIILITTFALAAAGGTVVEQLVHSVAVEHNLLGDPPDRNVSIYLPPGYGDNPDLRYPVLYLLHGFDSTDTLWFGGGYLNLLDVRQIADELIEGGSIQPMIIVMPDASNRYRGSFYVNSPVTGNWEDFIARELVAFIDGTYRSLARRESRGIAGHSMGGYGTLRLAMKYPLVYSAAYAMNPWGVGLLHPEESYVVRSNAWQAALQFESAAALDSADFESHMQIALAAAWSPNPDRPPFFVDLPFETVGGQTRRVEPVWGRWIENTPMGMLDRYGSNLKQYRGLAFDTGRFDLFASVPADTSYFSAALAEAGIAHTFEDYLGNHTDQVRHRLETIVLPFFSELLQPQSEAPDD